MIPAFFWNLYPKLTTLSLTTLMEDYWSALHLGMETRKFCASDSYINKAQKFRMVYDDRPLYNIIVLLFTDYLLQ